MRLYRITVYFIGSTLLFSARFAGREEARRALQSEFPNAINFNITRAA